MQKAVLDTSQFTNTLPQEHVVILMAVRDGADHLQEQLESIASQTHGNWRIIASDDGSRDNSREILDQFTTKGYPLITIDGPQLGLAANFMGLVRHLPTTAPSDTWLAFSDQDDVWMPERLESGIRALSRVDPATPALFCSRSVITDDALQSLRLSTDRPKPPGFRNALVQNIASGNTTLMNPAAARLVCAAAQEVNEVVVHDWWAYQLITGAGGVVIHQDRPSIYYRQHGENQIGANDSAKARYRRVMMILQGHFRQWNEINVAALRRSAHRLTPENRAVLDEFARMRHSSLLPRIWNLAHLRLYRQHLPGTCALWLSAMLRRL